MQEYKEELKINIYNDDLKPIKIILLFLIALVIFGMIKYSPLQESTFLNDIQDIFPKENKILAKNTIKEENTYQNNVVKIDFNNPIALSYKTKKEIYDIRKQAVATSIFARRNYNPSVEVFGGIADNKPWISTNSCSVNGKSKISGVSRVSIPVINPSVPVFIDFPLVFGASNYDAYFCNLNNNIIPSDIIYRKQQKEIEVVYKNIHYMKTSSFLYQFDGINARDLGYKYVHIDSSKTTKNIKFIKPTNASNKISEFQDFIHLGSSCGVYGGCNNLSPMQQELDFVILPNDGKTEIYLKLWKDKPKNPYDKADFYEKITVLNIIQTR